MFRRPTFIVFECLDGSGKSTCAAQLAEHMVTFMTTPSPGVRRYRDDPRGVADAAVLLSLLAARRAALHGRAGQGGRQNGLVATLIVR